ncbi:acetyl-CoA carboxylase biotin carboxylase subunit family protein [Fibrobacter sp.]|uniref:ATP-grasp domain-containing protein n=1 Tax=Fibrobacter sp. TaxID=35828 RepID=UPI00388E95C8
MSKGTIIVLGGTLPHAKLISYLKEEGYRTVLIDYTENPVAKPFADRHVQESSLDLDAVERIAREENALYIMDICTDRAIPPAAYVAEKLGLKHPYSYHTAKMATNKGLMKQFFMDNGIPSSDFLCVGEVPAESDVNLQYPLIVKPVDASGSIGITEVDSYEGLAAAVNFAIENSADHKAIIEEYIVGMEIQIDCFVVDSELKIFDIKEKRKFTDKFLTLSYGSLVPARISDVVKQNVITVCKNIASSIKIQNGPIYIQALVRGEEIFVIEFGLRFGGKLSFQIIKDLTGFDVIKGTANAYVGKTVDTIRDYIEDEVYTTHHVFPKAGVFKAVVGYEPLVADGTISDFKVYMKPNTTCLGKMASRERLASFILRSKDMAENDAKMRKILQNVEVLDVNDVPIMRKDIYEIE